MRDEVMVGQINVQLGEVRGTLGIARIERVGASARVESNSPIARILTVAPFRVPDHTSNPTARIRARALECVTTPGCMR
jgi:hypothetical protein